MQKIIIFIYVNLVLIMAVSCEKEDRDTELPVITMDAAEHFPQNCDTVYIGESFTLRALFTDNYELGSYTIEIHQNFDHHSHSTDVAECRMDSVKQAINPFLFIEQFDIQEGLREYNANRVIDIPEGVDSGDYHLMVRLTDRTGWQAIRGISIKVIDNP